jgi:hypothetical protein
MLRHRDDDLFEMDSGRPVQVSFERRRVGVPFDEVMMFISMPKLFAALPVLLLATIAACSGDSSSPQSEDTAAVRAKIYCEADKISRSSCNADAAQKSYDTCLDEWGACAGVQYTKVGLEAYARCMSARTCANNASGSCDCDKSDDACFAEAAKEVPASPRRDAYESACRRKLEECGKGTPTSFIDDWCTTGGFGWELFSDATYDALLPCFDGVCGTIGKCLRGVNDGLSPACVKTN